jgi:hypothetical protein
LIARFLRLETTSACSYQEASSLRREEGHVGATTGRKKSIDIRQSASTQWPLAKLASGGSEM